MLDGKAITVNEARPKKEFGAGGGGNRGGGGWIPWRRCWWKPWRRWWKPWRQILRSAKKLNFN
ncbi:MAG: hypothetical protein MZV70_38675 [Desulfobacterales bacterium]|nr:hypothetical protein [Desulfobacterales bacterium]